MTREEGLWVQSSEMGWLRWLKRLFGFGKQAASRSRVAERAMPGRPLSPARVNPVLEENPLLPQGGLRSSPTGMGPQRGNLSRRKIDAYKQQMLDGSFFVDPNNKIAGYYDDGRLIVTDGHHRIQAALELYQETGNAYYLNELIRFSMRGYTESSGIPGVVPVQRPAPLESAPPPQGWVDGPFPSAEPSQP